MTQEETDETRAARVVAEMIADFRKEVMDKLVADIQSEADAIEASGFDPARGRGRGSLWWADGG